MQIKSLKHKPLNNINYLKLIMSKFIFNKSGYVVSKNNLNKLLLAEIKKDLSVTPKTNDDYGEEQGPIVVYKEDPKTLTIPRYYGMKKLGKPIDEIDISELNRDFEFTGRLRPNQMEVATRALDTIKTQGGGILQLHTGYGKTTVALYLATVLKLKTLIIVHKTFLQDQWYDRIKQFTNASIGMIRQKKVDVDKDIVIGMLQSISMIDYDPTIFKQFDFVIIDECFPGYTKVITDDGLYTIFQLYDMWTKGKELPLIKSYNEVTKQFEYKKMTYAWQKHNKNLVKVKVGKKTIDCTPNHKFLTTKGYIEAQNLTSNDILMGMDNSSLEYMTYNISSVSDVYNHDDGDVYDIEVEDNHNFMVSNADDNFVPIVHNCHHCPSRVFSKALMKVNPKYTLGLSATPNRLDGLTKVIKWYLGDIIVKVERKGDNAVYVKSFEYQSDDKLFEEKNRWFKGKAKPDVVKMITNMYKIDGRNKLIADIINSLRLKDGRKTLVLSGRIEHLKQLKKMVDDMIKAEIDAEICGENEYSTAFYIGGMKDYELKESAEADILFATYSMAEEGLDIDGLNTLVLATPKKNIIQSIGRIMRKPIAEGDINPLVIDIVDNVSCFKNWGYQRNKYYKSKKYTIDTYRTFNDKCLNFKDYMVREGICTKTDINKPDFDARKEYIIKQFGMDTYKFERDIEFDNFPDEMFNYECDYGKIFNINHEFIQNNEVPVEISWPVFDIEI